MTWGVSYQRDDVSSGKQKLFPVLLLLGVCRECLGSLNHAGNMMPRHGMVFPGGNRQHQGCTELGITYTAFGLQTPSPSLVIPADSHFSPPQDPFPTDGYEGFSSLLSLGLACCRCVSPVERASNR